ncbi:hypothetical protein H8959_014980 [Pygathrix nigripes]
MARAAAAVCGSYSWQCCARTRGTRSRPSASGHRIPFGIIFGGTDVNEDANQGEKNTVMGRVLEEARFAVAFTESMKEMAQAHKELCECTIQLVPAKLKKKAKGQVPFGGRGCCLWRWELH